MQQYTIKRVHNGFHVIGNSNNWEEPEEQHVFQDASKPLTSQSLYLSEEAIAFEAMIKSVFSEYFQTKRNPGFVLQWKDKGWGDE